MKHEARLKAAFTRELRRQLPEFVMLEYATAGAPDREIVGNDISSRWEFKHCTPDFCSSSIQVLLSMRLAAQGHCRYVLWIETPDGEGKRTMVVHPTRIHDKTYQPEAGCHGHDMAWLVGQVKKVHGL